jgi:hypothetical protein
MTIAEPTKITQQSIGKRILMVLVYKREQWIVIAT